MSDELREFSPLINSDGYEMTLTFDQEQTTYRAVLEQILNTRVNILNLKPVENRLEQVFIQLTQSGHGEP